MGAGRRREPGKGHYGQRECRRNRGSVGLSLGGRNKGEGERERKRERRDVMRAEERNITGIKGCSLSLSPNRIRLT